MRLNKGMSDRTVGAFVGGYSRVIKLVTLVLAEIHSSQQVTRTMTQRSTPTNGSKTERDGTGRFLRCETDLLEIV